MALMVESDMAIHKSNGMRGGRETPMRASRGSEEETEEEERVNQ